jgi:hypothetical protein
VKRVKDNLPNAFGDYLDWEKVQKLGALGNYKHFIEVQKKKHPSKANVIKFGNSIMMPTMDEWDTGLGDAYPVLVREKVA